MARKLGVKDLTKSRISDADMEQQIRHGRKAPEGKLVMPSFEERLTAAQIQQLMTYVKRLRR